MSELLLTTTPGVEGHPIQAYLGLVSGEAILDSNLVRDVFAGIPDSFGVRAGADESPLRRAREAALQELAEAARGLGANAVVGVTVAVQVLLEELLLVSATGTAVEAEGLTLRARGGAIQKYHAPVAPPRPADEPRQPPSLAGLSPEQPIACFFCGRPQAPGEAQVMSLVLQGVPLQPLACEKHAAAVLAGERPPVLARQVRKQTAPWFLDPTFRPAWDWNPAVPGPTIPWDALPPAGALLSPQPRVIVHAADPRWLERIATGRS